MKKLFFMLMCVFFTLSICSVAQAETLDKVIAIVNSEPITQNELDQQMGIAKSQLQSANMPVPSDAKLRQQVLDKLIDMKLQLQIAQKLHMTVTDELLNKTIAGIASKNNMTVDQLKTAIQQHNMKFSDYKNQIRKEILLSQVTQTQVIPTIKLSEAEVDQAKAQLMKKGVKTDLDKKARMMLLQKKFPEAVQTWLVQLRSQAYVKILNH